MITNEKPVGFLPTGFSFPLRPVPCFGWANPHQPYPPPRENRLDAKYAKSFWPSWQNPLSPLLYPYMANEHKTKPLTLETLEKHNDGMFLPKLEQKFATKDDLVEWKDEILTSNDKVVGKLDKILTEQKAVGQNYNHLDKRVAFLEGKPMETMENHKSQIWKSQSLTPGSCKPIGQHYAGLFIIPPLDSNLLNHHIRLTLNSYEVKYGRLKERSAGQRRV